MSETLHNRFEIIDKNKQGLIIVQRATDMQKKKQVCIIQPSNQALLQPEGQSVFLQIHKCLGSGTAEMKPILVDTGPEKRPFAVYEKYRHPFKITTITEDQAWSMLGYLIPSVAINAVPFQKCLHKEDLCLDEEGRLFLCPKGVLYEDVLGNMNPYTSSGNILQKSLYGIGIILYELLSENLKFMNEDERIGFQQNPPSIGGKNSSLSSELIATIDTLIHPVPEKRTSVLTKVQSCEAPIFSLPVSHYSSASKPLVATSHKHSNTNQTNIYTSQAKPDLELPPILFVMTNTDVPNTIRRRVSALSELDDDNLSECLLRPKHTPVFGVRNERDIEEYRRYFTEIGINFKIQKKPSPVLPIMVGMLGLVLGFFHIAGFLLVGLTPVVIYFLHLQHAQYKEQWDELHRQQKRQPNTQKVLDAIQQTQRTVIKSSWPEIGKLDIYENLESLYANVDEKIVKKEDYELKMMTEIIDMCLQFEQLVENNTSDQDDAFLLESTKKNIQKLTKIADIKNI